MNTNTNTEHGMLPFPPELDITVYHSRAEVEEHRRKHEQVFAHNQKTKKLMEEAKQRKDAPTPPLTAEQYEQEQFARHTLQKAKKAALAEELTKKEKEKQELLLSSPAVVEVQETDPHSLAMTLNHWLTTRGYSIDTNSIRYFQHGLYALTLLAPANGKKASK